MSVKGFRLITGEVVMANVNSEEAEYFEVKEAAQLVTQEVEPGKMGVAFQPFVPFSTGVLKLQKTSINVTFDLDRQLENEYSRLFGSGIVVAAANEMPPIQK